MIRIFFLTIVLLASCVAYAQDATPNKESPDAGKEVAKVPTKTQIVLIDGTTVFANMAGVFFDVRTKFGTIKVPVEDLYVANLGYNLSDEEAAKVEKAFKNLNHADWKTRQLASNYLDLIGDRAYPMMPADEKVADAESKNRIAMWFKKAMPKKEYLQDQFDCEDGSFKGKILNKTIKVKHSILGDLTINVSDIKSLANMNSVAITIETDADWKLAGTIPPGSKTRVIASGDVDLWPVAVIGQVGAPGQYKATPKGYNTTGKGGQFMAGALIGKIDNGSPFLVGEDKMIEQSGTLYLRIVESPWNNKSSGSYNVKIDRK